jgi:hypothetical protein
VPRLSRYDIECGTRIEAVLASFHGRDADRASARVFAAVVHRRTTGLPDGTNNPFGVEGAGWVGVLGLAGTHLGHVNGQTAVFASTLDGALAAAVALNQRGFGDVHVAYRSGDAVRLARAIEASPLRITIDLTGLGNEVAGVRQQWWSVLADGFRFRHVGGPARARSR